MVFLGAVAIPAARSAGDPTASRRLITVTARRFAVVGAVAWLAILVTGFGLLSHKDLSVADLPDSGYGRRLLAKIVLLVAIGLATLAHGMWQGPRVRRAEAGDDAAAVRRWRTVGGALDALILLGSLAALWLATSLVA